MKCIFILFLYFLLTNSIFTQNMKLNYGEKVYQDSMTLKNSSNSLALYIKLNLRQKMNNEIVLPDYFSDSYFHILPNKSKEIILEIPNVNGKENLIITAEGLNIKRQTLLEL